MKSILFTLLIALWLSACGPAALPTAPPAAPATPVPATPPPGPTSTPAPLPTRPPTPSPTATPDPLAPYRSAMRAGFAADVDAVAAAGATRYSIQAVIEPPAAQTGPVTLTGEIEAIYTNTETVPLNEVYFHLYPNLPGYGGKMTVEDVATDGQPLPAVLEAENSALRVDLPAPLQPGQTIPLRLAYRVVVPGQSEQGYNIFIHTANTIALAGFYPVIAVFDDEGWNIDLPPPYGDAVFLDAALYRVRLTVPEGMVVVASGSQLNRQVNGNGTETLTLVSGPIREFYAAMNPAFRVSRERVNGVTVSSYYPADLEAGGRRALQYVVDALRLFDRLFGPYPYAELDIVATPTTAGGVEYPGVLVLAQALYRQPGSFFEHAAAHETAHQWWYAVVGNDQIDEPWLDESLTNFSTLLYWESLNPPDVAEEIRFRFFTGPYQQAKQEGHDRPVAGPVASFTEQEYSIFVYSKGPLFFDALRQEVGQDTLLKILRTYYQQYRYGIAYPDDLLRVIEQVSGYQVDPLYRAWIEP